jgi:WD40 repeat protein
VVATADKNQFLAATASLAFDNEVHLLETSRGSSELSRKGVWTISAEVTRLEPHPRSAVSVLAVSRSASAASTAAVWSLTPGSAAAECVSVLPAKGGAVAAVWSPSGDRLALSTLSGPSVSIVESGSSREDWSAPAEQSCPLLGESVLRFHPHFSSQLLHATDGSIHRFDTRSPASARSSILQAHGGLPIRDLDHCPNRPHQFASAGDDCTVRVWDLRNLSRPLKALEHLHWVWCARYHPSYEQLLLSSGSDCMVKLWDLASVPAEVQPQSSAAVIAKPSACSAVAECVKVFDEQEDTIYAVAWAIADSWLFASLAYDGRVVTNHVPAAQADKIMLAAAI